MFNPFSGNPKLNDRQLIADIKSGGIPARRAVNTLFDAYAYMVLQGQKKYSLSEDDALSAYNQSIIAVQQAIKADHFRGDSSL